MTEEHPCRACLVDPLHLTLSAPILGGRETSNRKAQLNSRLAILSLGAAVLHTWNACASSNRNRDPQRCSSFQNLSSHALSGPSEAQGLRCCNSAIEVPEKARLPTELWLLSRPLSRNHSIVHVTILVSEEGVLPSLDYGLKDYPTTPALLHTTDLATWVLPSHVIVHIGGHNRYWALQPPALIQDVMLFTLKLS